ncbi:hypothetical protein WMY93_032262 [Mugilogobius chulae]|uniref:Uncharacterized protein n=1 Tax=Mugilogobius chulae TaxID=88201 RepID=A0AAW0MJ06_9GOBI
MSERATFRPITHEENNHTREVSDIQTNHTRGERHSDNHIQTNHTREVSDSQTNHTRESTFRPITREATICDFTKDPQKGELQRIKTFSDPEPEPQCLQNRTEPD